MASVVPNNEATQFRAGEEQVEIARKGGIASGEARREKATFKKTLESLLDEKGKNGKTYREMIALGQIKGAIDGKAENFKTLLALLGELQQEEQTSTPEININIVDNSELEKIMYEDNN